MRYFLLYCVCTLPASLLVNAQRVPGKKPLLQQADLIDIAKTVVHSGIRRPVKIRGKSVYFSFIPGGDQSASPANAFITSTTAAFYMDDRKTNFLSTVTFTPYVTFKGRVGYSLRSNLWFNDNKWAVLGDIRFFYYPQYTWGLGGNPDNRQGLMVAYKYVRFYQTFLRRIKPYLFGGFGYHFDGHFDMDTPGDSNQLQRYTNYHYGTGISENSISSGITANLLYDSRRNSLNPVPGFYANMVYRFNPLFLGSNTYWHSIYIDLRKYVAFDKAHQNMLAFWSFYWKTLNSRAPYLDLPAIGWDPYQQRSGRGIEQNRYRGSGLFYMESEYRRDITPNGLLGFVLFANLNTVSEPLTHKYVYWHPAAGGGLRIKINKGSGTNLSLDYGMSKDYSGLYLNLGETF